MKIVLKYFFLFSFIIFIEACQKEIKIKPLDYVNKLSVECILYPGRVPQLYLSNSVDFFNVSTTPSQLFVRGAVVSITGITTDNLSIDSTFDNFRCRWVLFYKGSVVSQIGQTYNLSIAYAGKTYTATTTINEPKVTINKVSYVSTFHDVYGAHEGIILNFNDIAGSENFYRFQLNRSIDSSVYGASSLGQIHSTCTNGNRFYVTEFGRSVYFDKGVDGQTVEFVTEPAYLHQQDDTAYVFVQSLDKNAAEFYDNLDKQKLAQFNPFIEPVFLKSKIEGCIGVFGSIVLSDSLLFVYPE